MSSVRREKKYGDGSSLKSTGKSVSNSKSSKEQVNKGKPATRYTTSKPTTKTISATDPAAKYDKQSIKKKLDRKEKEKEKENRHVTSEKSTPPKDVHKSDVKKDAKEDKTYLKDVLEKKALIKRKEEERRREMEAIEDEVQKQMNEVKMELEKSKIKRDRTRTRTLSPTEVKQLVVPQRIESDERINTNELETAVDEPIGDENEEYESDFEDYESDFEKDESELSGRTSRKDSDLNEADSSDDDGERQTKCSQPDDETPETPTKKEEQNSWKAQTQSPTKKEEQEDTWKAETQTARWKEDLQMRHLRDIKNCIEKENIEISEKRKSIGQSMVKAEERNALTEGHLIDFSKASKKQKIQKKANATKKRGNELLSMITLDAITYNILEIPPTPYDVFMRAFGKSNTKQVYVQTNDDVLEEEVQTVEIKTCNKWTQHPADYLGRKEKDGKQRYVLTKEERLGVGTDDPEESTKNEYGKEVTFQPRTSHLHEFLSWASQIVLEALERRSFQFLNLEKMPNNDKDMAFADGFMRLNTEDVSPLADKSVTNLCLLRKTSKKLLAVHLNKNKNFQKCILSVWSLGELSKPLKVLVASNRVTSCTFGPNQGNLVIAGLSDGTLSLWDLREPSVYHNQPLEGSNCTLQHPTYTTAGDMEESNHSTSIVSVQLMSETEGGFEKSDDFSPLQVCSLDENGIIVVWSVIQLEKLNRTEPSNDLGLSHWGKLKLVKSSSFTVFDNLKNEISNLYVTFNDLLINEAEDNGFYIANSTGTVNHLSSYGSPMKPKLYLPSKRDFVVEATCLELCPFDGNYFLVGCGDGSIRLHSRHQERPLITLYSNVCEGERQTSVVTMCWLNTRPCVIFSLDSKSRIHVWDLAVSDMYPEMTVVLSNKKILSMKLLTNSDASQIPFIVTGMEDGSVEIHRVNKDYGRKTTAETITEKKMFLRYVSIL